jgi:hypothetical protein
MKYKGLAVIKRHRRRLNHKIERISIDPGNDDAGKVSCARLLVD